MRTASPRLTALLPLLLACAGDADNDTTEDPLCPDAWDWDGAECVPRMPETDGVDPVGSPEPLTPGELDEATQLALAERFQPAQVYSGEQVWAVSTDYCAADGADLYRFARDEEEHLDGELVATNAELSTLDYATLPVDDYAYQMDCPGQNTGPGADEATWFDRWDAIQGTEHACATFRPLHYVHLAWFDREAGLLMIQYWFWYPFNKFANNHEGDWEHINTIIDMSGASPALVDVHYYFHSGSLRAFQRITRITDDAGGDHPVVFVGGCGGFDGWEGCYSGASYPWPGVYHGTAELIDEDVTVPKRYVHPDDIDLVLWPEADEIAPGGDLARSWLPLYIFHGEWHTAANSPIILYAAGDGPPTPPSWKGDWNTGVDVEDWSRDDEHESSFLFFDPPDDWEILYNPGQNDFVDIP